jgi:hypothetical protein
MVTKIFLSHLCFSQLCACSFLSSPHPYILSNHTFTTHSPPTARSYNIFQTLAEHSHEGGNGSVCLLPKAEVVHSPVCSLLYSYQCWIPITVAARSKAWTLFARLDTGIVGSNPTEGMDVCVCVVLCMGSGFATSLSLDQGVLPSV